LHQVNEAASIIYDSAHKDANIIFGAGKDPDMAEELKVTVIATGFANEKKESQISAKPIDFKMFNERKNTKPAPRAVQMEMGGGNFGMYKFDKQDLDVPAFLRKRMD
jgi:cell division protein FtsZ